MRNYLAFSLALALLVAPIVYAQQPLRAKLYSAQSSASQTPPGTRLALSCITPALYPKAARSRSTPLRTDKKLVTPCAVVTSQMLMVSGRFSAPILTTPLSMGKGMISQHLAPR